MYDLARSSNERATVTAAESLKQLSPSIERMRQLMCEFARTLDERATLLTIEEVEQEKKLDRSAHQKKKYQKDCHCLIRLADQWRTCRLPLS